jgi:hypothetical protein
VLGGKVFFKAVAATKALVAHRAHGLSQVHGQVALAVVFPAEQPPANAALELAIAAPDRLGRKRLPPARCHCIACKVKQVQLYQQECDFLGRFDGDYADM